MAVDQGKTYQIKSHAGEGLCLRLASGTQTVAAHKLLQTAAENTTNMGQRWQLSVVSQRWNIVSAINNTYALNFNTAKTDRKAEIYPYSNSDANTSIDLVIVDSDNRIYKIRITIDGTMYYLTAGSKTGTAYATWETASGNDDQEWQFVEIVTIDLPSNRTYNWNQFYQGVYDKIKSNAGCSWTCALDVANIYGPDSYEPADMPDNAWDGICRWYLPHDIESKEDCIGSINGYTENLWGENCLAVICSELDNNRPVIIELRGSDEQHFVVAYGYINSGTEKSDILVFDPGVESETDSRNQKNGIIWTLSEAENLVSKYINRIRTTNGR